jgi:hypothetical protein
MLDSGGCSTKAKFLIALSNLSYLTRKFKDVIMMTLLQMQSERSRPGDSFAT